MTWAYWLQWSPWPNALAYKDDASALPGSPGAEETTNGRRTNKDLLKDLQAIFRSGSGPEAPGPDEKRLQPKRTASLSGMYGPISAVSSSLVTQPRCSKLLQNAEVGS